MSQNFFLSSPNRPRRLCECHPPFLLSFFSFPPFSTTVLITQGPVSCYFQSIVLWPLKSILLGTNLHLFERLPTTFSLSLYLVYLGPHSRKITIVKIRLYLCPYLDYFRKLEVDLKSLSELRDRVRAAETKVQQQTLEKQEATSVKNSLSEEFHKIQVGRGVFGSLSLSYLTV